MKFYSVIEDEYDRMLLPGNPESKSLGPLPKGIYNYNLYFQTPYIDESMVTVELFEGLKCINKQVLKLYSVHNYFNLSFETKGEKKEDCTVLLSLTQGKEALAVLPVSPTLPQKNLAATPLTSPIVSLVQQDLVAYQQRVSLSKNNDQAPTAEVVSTFAATLNNQLNTNLQHLLTFEQAERQLDYVIQHKLFAPADARGLRKWKRSMYRGAVQFLYRKLVVGKNRKAYIVKLYRNYQNNNILSEIQP